VLLATGVRSFWAFHTLWVDARHGTLRATSALVHSPLNQLPAAYCSWTVRRRLLSEGRDDEVTGELASDIRVEVGEQSWDLDLDAVFLHLSDSASDAWTAEWDGLSAQARAEVSRQLPDSLPGALYHCHQVIVLDGAEITLGCRRGEPYVVTDLSPAAAQSRVLRALAGRLTPGLMLLAAGVVGLTG